MALRNNRGDGDQQGILETLGNHHHVLQLRLRLRIGFTYGDRSKLFLIRIVPE